MKSKRAPIFSLRKMDKTERRFFNFNLIMLFVSLLNLGKLMGERFITWSPLFYLMWVMLIISAIGGLGFKKWSIYLFMVSVISVIILSMYWGYGLFALLGLFGLVFYILIVKSAWRYLE